MTSSIMRYREENGRTYHSFREGRYVLPNDAVSSHNSVPSEGSRGHGTREKDNCPLTPESGRKRQTRPPASPVHPHV
ncbi:methyltransferase domain-containing protein [Colletotrichum kahawae]|uniref:Methyltransferase domain-containing protein n=1 Tax=Colletotrichum kahawae TaxID=34407 RepID=A0AAD9Y3D0_COLKA|nr:methyltransferase domain-containing protein [Colletotrichum kahawae]